MLKHTKLEELAIAYKALNLEVLSEFKPLIITKTEHGGLFPPYVPFVGKGYEKFRVAFYGTAQSPPAEGDYIQSCRANTDKLVERLNYSPDFTRKYLRDEFHFTDIAIKPYREGVIPALLGVLLLKNYSCSIKSIDEVHDKMATSNYYKFSLSSAGKDLNPNVLGQAGYKYHGFNDTLVYEELKALKPKLVVTFKGRQVEKFKEYSTEFGYKLFIINDPAWILRGGGGCFGENGAWNQESLKIKDRGLVNLVNDLLENLNGSYKGKKNAVKTYVLKYINDLN